MTKHFSMSTMKSIYLNFKMIFNQTTTINIIKNKNLNLNQVIKVLIVRIEMMDCHKYPHMQTMIMDRRLILILLIVSKKRKT